MSLIGHIRDLASWQPPSHLLKKGIDYLFKLPSDCLADKEAGYTEKIPLQGEDLFAIFQVYMPKDPLQARLEAHRKYIDLQFVIAGAEAVRLECADDLDVDIPYDSEKDVLFYRGVKGTDSILRAGMIALLYPGDAHAPGLFSGEPVVRKCVVKVKAF